MGLYHLIMFADRSKRLTYYHSCKGHFCTLQVEKELCSFFNSFRWQFVTNYLECNNKLSVVKYKDLLPNARFVG